MNLPNAITLSRLLLALPFMALLEWPGGGEPALRIALALFVIASLTDWVDGYLARKLNQVSELGKLLDPLVDKLLVTAAIVAFVGRGVVPAWSVTLILFREFLVTGMRVMEAHKGVIIPAGTLGKWKTASQLVSITLLLWALSPSGQGLLPGWAADGGMGLYWIGLALTIVSGVQYLVQARGLFK